MEPEKKPEKKLNFNEGNRFFIYGPFDDSIATDIIPDLIAEIECQKKLKEPKISFYIDSNGGSTRYLYNILALIESAKLSGIIIETYVFGVAYSCGSILAASGTKGYRFISYLAEHICHLGSASAKVINDVELEREAASIQAHFNRVRDLYKKYAHLKDLENAIKFDSWYIRGRDIIDNGLADKMVD